MQRNIPATTDAKSIHEHRAPIKSAKPYSKNLGRNHLNEKAAALVDLPIEKSMSDFLAASENPTMLTTDPRPKPRAMAQ